MVTRFYHFFCGLLLLLTLSSCGFQLRGYGSQTFPFHTLYLLSNPLYTDFSKKLRQSLIAMGIDVRTSPPAPVVLQILSQESMRTITNLGNAGQTTTYLLSYIVFFQLLDSTHRILLPRQQIRVTRNFSITSNQLTGDLNIQRSLEEDMQNDAVQQLITRLTAPVLRQRLCQLYSLTQ
jgi:LPS-assembly lipoprotein